MDMVMISTRLSKKFHCSTKILQYQIWPPVAEELKSTLTINVWGSGAAQSRCITDTNKLCTTPSSFSFSKDPINLIILLIAFGLDEKRLLTEGSTIIVTVTCGASPLDPHEIFRMMTGWPIFKDTWWIMFLILMMLLCFPTLTLTRISISRSLTS